MARFVRLLGLCLGLAFCAGCSGSSKPGTFTLSVTPASLNIQAGSSGQISVAAVPSGNFTTPVSVQLAGLPAGITASPASLTLMPGTPQTVTLAASVTTPAAVTQLSLSAKGGSLTQTAAVALTTTPPPSFSLKIDTASSNLLIGGPGLPLTVSVLPSNGFSGTVAVTLAGLGAGVTASTGPSFNLLSSASQTVTLSATAVASPGPFTLAVAAASVSPAAPATYTTSVNLLLTSAPATVGPDVTTFHYDNTRQGLNAKEILLTLGTVNATGFGLRGLYPADGKVDAQPLYVGGLKLGAAISANVLYVATEHDSVYALNADTGVQVWKSTVLGTGETPSDSRNCFQVTPEIGITSTPVIDRGYGPNGAIFLIGMSKDTGGKYHQRLHALDLATGAELTGSPTEIAATYPGTGANSSGGNIVFDPAQYVARAGLLLLNGAIYSGWSSHCDIQPYTGWVMGYSETSLKQSTVLNLTPNGSEGSVWMSGFGLAADASGNIFLSDANGTLDPAFNAAGFPSQNDFGNALLKLSTASGLAVADFFEPYNAIAESNADLDMGSAGAMLLPDLLDSTGAVRHLVIAGGKDNNLYLADRDNLGKFSGGSSNTNLYQEIPGANPNQEFGGPAYFNNTVFYGGVGENLKAHTLTNARLSPTPTSQSSARFAYPGTIPSVSANGTQNGIVWALESAENAPAVLHAYDAANLQHELYNSNQAANQRDHFGNGNKFITPMVSNGSVFVGTPSGVAVFGLLH